VLTFTLAVTDSLGLPDPTPDEVVVTVLPDQVLLPVNSLNDPGDGTCDSSECTLREAVTVAAGGDTITFDPALAGGTITLGSQITLDKDLTIDGSGLSSHVQVSGGGSVRVFAILEGLTIAISHLDIRDGNAPSGGGIDVLASTLTVSNTTFSGNSADDGGAIDVNDGTLFVTDCSFVGNSAAVYGGAIDNNMGTTTIVGSTFSGNSSGQYGGGVFNNYGDVAVTNSTFSGNSAALSGGGLLNYEGTMRVRNSTLSGNSAPSGGGILNSTNGTLYLWNTIVAGSPSGGDCLNDGTLATNTHNLIEDGTCSPAVTGDPMLGPLADNGGPTLTLALQLGSPAIDAGDDATCEATDQRGADRPLGAHCDIGAYEAEVTYVYVPLVMR
jgi:CSLREA domain-containing protein